MMTSEEEIDTFCNCSVDAESTTMMLKQVHQRVSRAAVDTTRILFIDQKPVASLKEPSDDQQQRDSSN